MRPLSHLHPSSTALIALLAVGCASTPEAPPPSPTHSTAPVDALALGVGDVVEVRVFREPDLTGVYVVDQDGGIDFPLIGRVTLLGRKAKGVEDEVRARLADGFLVEPQVSILVKERNSHKVHVLGQVNKPGSLPLEPGMTVIQAVAQAGGFTKLAATNRVTLTRVQEGREKSFRLRVGDIRSGDASNVELLPGDIVFVPEALF